METSVKGRSKIYHSWYSALAGRFLQVMGNYIAFPNESTFDSLYRFASSRSTMHLTRANAPRILRRLTILGRIHSNRCCIESETRLRSVSSTSLSLPLFLFIFLHCPVGGLMARNSFLPLFDTSRALSKSMPQRLERISVEQTKRDLLNARSMPRRERENGRKARRKNARLYVCAFV